MIETGRPEFLWDPYVGCQGKEAARVRPTALRPGSSGKPQRRTKASIPVGYREQEKANPSTPPTTSRKVGTGKGRPKPGHHGPGHGGDSAETAWTSRRRRAPAGVL